jgi:endonuclease/exonuclease/phosphatase family metal-dependent hydrolase
MAGALLGFILLPLTTAAAGDTNALGVMTFNLRFASNQKPNAWPDRRPVMRECIRQTRPDLIGTQEGVYSQLKELAADVPEYDWIGLGREGGSRGEFMAVFYRRARFEPLEFDHFWLSDTPDVMASTSWGNTIKRMATWVKFRDRQADQVFYLLNTHFDHQVQVSREKSAALIRDRISRFDPALPVLVVGDFNATAGANPAYDTLVRDGGLTDLHTAAYEQRGPKVNTFHNFKGPQPGDDRIDWILGRGGMVAESAEIVTFARDGQFPSDHFPVLVQMRWATTAANPAPR